MTTKNWKPYLIKLGFGVSDPINELINTLGVYVQIHADQVVMSHSPLSMFRQFHDRHILAVGQGPIMEIAEQLVS